ncbi:MAG: hypothetical protein E7357_07440 [Clostridiales bacterium]|nr:hypothetical protein [Clostridiales bacterium]
MLLSDLVEKNVYVGKQLKGVCLAVGISLKSYAVKYLHCANVATYNPLRARIDFSVPVAAVEGISDGAIRLSRLRPVYPKNSTCIFLSRPVYSNDGSYLGDVTDVDLRSFAATRLFTDANKSYPFSAILAYGDAVILRKLQTYPLGQRIHACLVSKPVLKKAIENKTLIRLTLALPPFHNEYFAESFKR